MLVVGGKMSKKGVVQANMGERTEARRRGKERKGWRN